MSAEHADQPIPITSIRFDLAERALTLESNEQILARVTFSSGTIYFQTPRLVEPPIAPEGIESAPSPEQLGKPQESEGNAAPKEKEASVVLAGRLLGRVRKGRPDVQGHETAWARFAAHEEERPDAHLYSTTFHRGSARTALTLPEDAQIAVEGFPHPSNDPTGNRLDTLSVFRILRQRNPSVEP